MTAVGYVSIAMAVGAGVEGVLLIVSDAARHRYAARAWPLRTLGATTPERARAVGFAYLLGAVVLVAVAVVVASL
jgi:hypothetical protein